jgi:hypothetical protein
MLLLIVLDDESDIRKQQEDIGLSRIATVEYGGCRSTDSFGGHLLVLELFLLDICVLYIYGHKEMNLELQRLPYREPQFLWRRAG